MKLKTQQRFKSKRHNVFTEEINKIALCSTDDKKIQLNDLIETYVHRMSKDIVSEKEEIKCSNIIKRSENDEIWWCYKRKNKISQSKLTKNS